MSPIPFCPPWVGLTLTGALLTLCLGAGLRSALRVQGTWPGRLAAAALPLTLLLVGFIYLAQVCVAPDQPWNGVRLTPAFALARGYPLYPHPGPTGSGPILTQFYGPVAMLLQLPATLASTPAAAILIAACCNVLFLLLPLWLVHRVGAAASTSSRRVATAAFVFAAAAMFHTAGTRHMATMIHADAPAVGLGLLSCLVLLRAPGEPGWRRLLASALLAVLAVWTKQPELPLLMALPAWLGLAHGARAALRFLACAAAAGLAVSATVVAAFGFDGVFFNLITIPAGFPWQLRGISNYLWMLRVILSQSAPFLALLAAGGYLSARGTGLGQPAARRAWLAGQAWTLPATVALCCLPLSALAPMRLGSALNSAHALFYTLVAASLVLAQVARGPASRVTTSARWALALACAVFLGLRAGDVVLTVTWRQASATQRQVYEHARAHPGQVYFPWYPLAVLLGEGRLYHVEYAAFGWWVAGHEASDEVAREHLPADARYVAYQDRELRWGRRFMLERYLPAYSWPAKLPELPGWTLFAREEPTSGSRARASSRPPPR